MHPAWRDGLAGLDRDPEGAPLLFQMPVRRIPVDIAAAPRLIEALDPQERAPFAMVAKLGAKSWRDGGSLRVIQEGRPLANELATLLGTLTTHQERYLDLVRPQVSQLDLSLFRYVDFSQISEARWHVRDGRAWQSSQCRRSMPATVLDHAQEAMRTLVLAVSARLAFDAIVDCTVESSGRVRVLEINSPRSSWPKPTREAAVLPRFP